MALSLRGAGKPLDDDDPIACILHGLGSEFDPIVTALNARDMFPSLEGVITNLCDFEIRLQNANTTSNIAFYTAKIVLLHVKFNELHFPFKTAAISPPVLSPLATPQLFQLQTLPKSLENHVLPYPLVSVPTNEEPAINLIVTSPIQSVLPSSPTESSPSILPSQIHPIQALRAWYLKFNTYIQQLGFSQCPYDQYLFSHQQGPVLILLIYVDDILLTRSSSSQMSDFITHLSSMFRMKDLSDVHYFLGLQITRTTTTLTITQTRCHSFSIRNQLSATKGTLLPDPMPLRQLVRLLQYLTLTCPYISYVVHHTNLFPTVTSSSTGLDHLELRRDDKIRI
ncbi:hypothetical protein SADUNF_Sadunf18G0061700 [Salix dunnii]|uniref:Reverse transcriptase Ty1/copia-type domain-containing protein n=1 Tax=Salix dunnii TaxID=1413687 RepID=A0A835J6A5_9ROSI|nr:hypothetical protein SADUNF_Sadunf18G0061700 [Salix dunnii]